MNARVYTGSTVYQTIKCPTLLTSAGAIILLIFSTALETPTGDKQTVTEREKATMQSGPHR